jgi:hypothetical protein
LAQKMGRQAGAPPLVALLLGAALFAAAPAAAKPYAPPNGTAYHGVSDTGAIEDLFAFADQVGAHPALTQTFYHWDVPLTTGAFYRWAATDTRGVLSLSTAPGGGEERITPRQIARGFGDRYILNLGRTVAASGQTVYIRLMAEMNGHWNPYCAYNADGTRRREGHGKRWFRRAWRRFALIVRGGSRAEINRRLLRQGMPRILRATSETDPVYAGGPNGDPHPVPELMPQPRVALMWVPQSFGSPNIRGNQPDDYWPGGRYVDWIGFDIYAKYRGAFDEDHAFIHDHPGKPVVIGEYSPWDNDFSGAFTSELYGFARRHVRVKMLLYYRSVNTTNAFNVQFYPGAQGFLRGELVRARYPQYAPGVTAIPDPQPPPPPPPPPPAAARRPVTADGRAPTAPAAANVAALGY